jgi:hypothetical protein
MEAVHELKETFLGGGHNKPWLIFISFILPVRTFTTRPAHISPRPPPSHPVGSGADATHPNAPYASRPSPTAIGVRRTARIEPLSHRVRAPLTHPSPARARTHTQIPLIFLIALSLPLPPRSRQKIRNLILFMLDKVVRVCQHV